MAGYDQRSQLQEFTSNVFISNTFGARNKDLLHKVGITHILICAAEQEPIFPNDFTYLRLEAFADNNTPDRNDLQPHVVTALPWIQRARAGGGRVLLHCAAGISRSGAIAVAFTMWESKLTFETALARVRQARAIVDPNPGFGEQLGRMDLQALLAS